MYSVDCQVNFRTVKTSNVSCAALEKGIKEKQQENQNKNILRDI